MHGMGAGMRRARLGREWREWRCHPHIGEETWPERGRAARRGGARGTAGGHGTGHGRDTPGPRADPSAPPVAPTRLDSGLPISHSHPTPHTPGWR